MSQEIKKTILSIVPFYVSKQCPAFDHLIKAIEEIPDEEFTQIAPQSLATMNQRIQYLLDETFFSLINIIRSVMINV